MNTKLTIGYEQLDFNEPFNVMFSIGDIRNLSFGSINRSYTLNIPLTRTNKRLLKFVTQSDVRTEPSSLARLYLGEMQVISGKLKVMSYNDYFAKAIIESDYWIDDLKEKKMIELDLSASDHTLIHANVENSWAAAYPVYRYPMIDFGALVSAEYGSTAKWYPNDFIPMISIASLIAKIIEPFTITSAWLATGFVKDLFILAREALAAETFIKEKNLELLVTNTSDNYDTGTILAYETGLAWLENVKCIFTTETQDEGNDWSSNTYTVPAAGTYRFKASLKLYNDTPANPNVTINTETVTLSIIRDRAAAEIVLATISSAAYVATELIHNVRYELDSLYWHLEAGDTVFVRLNISCNATNNTAGTEYISVGVSNDASSFENVWGSANRYSGLTKTISLEEMLPDMTQLDFLAAARDMANLRFWLDKARQVVHIEPWDTFVSSNVIDLTSYIDFEDNPGELISPNYSKNIFLRWKDDTDKSFEEYYKSNTTPLGEKEINLTSVFAKKEIEYREHPFSTIHTGANYTLGNYALLMPRIWNTVPLRPYNMFDRKTGFNTRLVEWKGLTSGLTWYYETETKTTYPKIAGVTWDTLYAAYWQKHYHYVDKGKIYTFKLKVTPGMMNQFFTVVDTAANEAFRPTYSVTLNGIKSYYFMQRFTTDGNIAEIELILKQ